MPTAGGPSPQHVLHTSTRKHSGTEGMLVQPEQAQSERYKQLAIRESRVQEMPIDVTTSRRQPGKTHVFLYPPPACNKISTAMSKED
jgi:hypothetical protein